jgi:hypothetical protein
MRLNSSWWVSFLLALSIGLVSIPAQADENYTFIIQKQEAKKNTRWSLAEWLETRDRMRLMDLWLAIHSPTPYEFYIGGDYQFGEYSNGARFTGWKAFVAAYATIFGLELQRENSPNPRWFGLFNFRFFGYHAQGTNITFHLGLRANGDGSSTRNGLMGLSLSFYFARFFGVHGLWYNYFDSNTSTSGAVLTGSRYEGGAFLDFSFLRVYGNYFSEPETSTTAGIPTDTSRTGFELGTMIFF